VVLKAKNPRVAARAAAVSRFIIWRAPD